MDILIALFPLIVMIAMGYLLKRSQYLATDFWAGAEKFNYFILFPTLLFTNLAYIELDLDAVKLVLATLFIIIIISSLLLWSFKLWRYIPAARFGVYMQSHIRFNTYMGLSLMTPLFGAKGMQLFAMIMVVSIPLVNIISVLSFSQRQGVSFKNTLLSVFKNPLILGCIVGMLFNLSGLKLFIGIENALKLLAGMSLPLGLICVGAGLQFSALGRSLPRLAINTVGRLVLMPLLAYAICFMMPLSQLEKAVLVVFFALPTATASYMLTKFCQGDSELMAGVISLQTLCFALSFPVLMWLLF